MNDYGLISIEIKISDASRKACRTLKTRIFLITAIKAISTPSDTSRNDIVNVITPFNSADNDVRNVREGKTQFACHVD